MDIEKLERANALKKKIDALQEALNAFEWPFSEEEIRRYSMNKSRNPTLSIEYDDNDGDPYRAKLDIPMPLNNELIKILKDNIEDVLKESKIEFEKL